MEGEALGLSDGGVKDVGLDVIGLADRLAVGD